MPCGDAEPFARDDLKNGDSMRAVSVNPAVSRITTCGPFGTAA
jgi:hypothetical protein